jgi:hypothetical protein
VNRDVRPLLDGTPPALHRRARLRSGRAPHCRRLSCRVSFYRRPDKANRVIIENEDMR